MTPSFSAPSEVVRSTGLLFDMDGTIIDSTSAIVKHWEKLGKQLGVDPNVILATSHGRRSIDTLRMYDPQLANWAYVNHIESLIPKEYGQDALEILGSRTLLENLEVAKAPWMIVTSGTRPLVTGWLDVMKMAHPKELVVADDVEEGKPHPACYILGRSRLGLDVNDTSLLVFEDSDAGIRAGKAAGFRVVALATTHEIEQLQKAGADWIVQDMRSVELRGWDAKTGVVSIGITGALAS